MAIEYRPAGQTDFAAEVREQDGAVLVELSGELDLATAEDVRETLVRPDVLGAPAVRLDLTQVTFLQSTAIGLIVSACRRIRSSGGTFSVTCAEGIALRALEVTGLVEYLQIEVDAS